NVTQKYCSILCMKRAWADRHRDQLREKWQKYQQRYRRKVLLTKRKYNTSPKGREAQKRYMAINRSRLFAKYLHRYHTDPKLKAIHLSRGKANKLLRKSGRLRVCEGCGGMPARLYAHHKNENPLDNRLRNLGYLCSRCHAEAHS